MSHSISNSFDREKFYNLSELQRSLLQVISIVYAPVAATPFASCLHRLGINDPKLNESFTLHSLRPFLVDLIHGNWLVGEQGKYHCPAGLREDILLTAIDDDVFTQYSEQVLKSFSATESFGRVLWQSLEHGLSHARIYLFQGKAEKLEDSLKNDIIEFVLRWRYEKAFQNLEHYKDLLGRIKPTDQLF